MRTLAALVFPGFQTLDLHGPLEMLGDHDVGAVDFKMDPFAKLAGLV